MKVSDNGRYLVEYSGQLGHRVVGMHFKGVFTRDRRPKPAARRLREF